MDEMNLGPEAQELHDSIVAEIQSGVLKLKDGLPFGTGDETEMQYDVTLRELTAGDLIDAQAAAEKLVMSKEGPVLVSSPSRMGLEMLRRQIASVGCIKGPLSLALMRKLSVDKPGQPGPVGEYLNLRDYWHVTPWLETRLGNLLAKHLQRYE